MLYQLSYTPIKSSRFISYKKIEIKYFFQLCAKFGRLVVKFKKGRTPYLKLTHGRFAEIKIKQILEQPILSKQFEHYESVHLNFVELKNIVDKQIEQWKEKLSFIQGIYLIFDNESKKNVYRKS